MLSSDLHYMADNAKHNSMLVTECMHALPVAILSL